VYSTICLSNKSYLSDHKGVNEDNQNVIMKSNQKDEALPICYHVYIIY